MDVEADRVVLPEGSVVRFADLRRIADRENAVFFPEDDALYMVAISDEHFYKLVPTEGAPTLEVDGIRMHRTKEVTPDADARKKIMVLGVRGGRVLDTCAGLGYTAQAALGWGAGLVVSVELSPEVLRIAEVNPWSRGLFEDRRIHLLLGDAYIVLDALPRGFFNYVVHDPPRLPLAGRLYSQEFYAKMFRVLRDGGRLFHYTGEPGSRRRGIDLRRGVARRLGQIGFENVIYHPEVRGVTCEKPRRR
ncbi:SAM-dependent methyltransferase [Candidatus Bathyarchaeota archaeon]|nr:MAG: SAM-dependent methyltransferase [Candidatus Bathyarchaeota archaeon]